MAFEETEKDLEKAIGQMDEAIDVIGKVSVGGRKLRSVVGNLQKGLRAMFATHFVYRLSFTLST